MCNVWCHLWPCLNREQTLSGVSRSIVNILLGFNIGSTMQHNFKGKYIQINLYINVIIRQLKTWEKWGLQSRKLFISCNILEKLTLLVPLHSDKAAFDSNSLCDKVIMAAVRKNLIRELTCRFQFCKSQHQST